MLTLDRARAYHAESIAARLAAKLAGDWRTVEAYSRRIEALERTMERLEADEPVVVEARE